MAKAPEKPKYPRGEKKPGFEDGVRSALITGAVVCAVVFAAGVFFAVRTVFDNGFTPPPAANAAGVPSGEAGPEGEWTPWPDSAGENPDSGGGDILGELEEAIRQLEAGTDDAGTAAEAANAGQSGAKAANPSVRQGAPKAGLSPALPLERRGILVFVIDDAGNNLGELDPFLKFPGPLTIAVLPGLPNSAGAARRIRDAKKELFLHQPMEPLGGQDPGPGAIRTGMSADEAVRIVTKNLDEIRPVAGMNNHEGSKATMDRDLMKAVLEVCRERELAFLDSRTIAGSVIPSIAAAMAFPVAERDVFLDNEQDRDSILAALEEGCRRAERNGLAIMIGHAWSPQLPAVLNEMYPVLIKKGFYLTTVSAILNAGK